MPAVWFELAILPDGSRLPRASGIALFPQLLHFVFSHPQ